MYCFHCMSPLPDGAQLCEKCHKTPTATARPHHLAVGTLLNRRYLIGQSIGEGGFGITYIALDTNLELKIAVKEFFPRGFADRDNSVTNEVTLSYSEKAVYYHHAKDRFLQEAQSIAKFSDEKAIVDVRDYFTENNTAYIVMEYVDGTTLARHIKENGVFSASDIFSRMIPMMDALDHMHHESVIHRDISPDNIMMTPDGQLKLMDFGSARYYQGDKKHTMSVLFKPGYVPVEQYSADGSQGPWTDVYGLCATIYKCITGTTPIDALSRCQQDQLQKPSALGVSISAEAEDVLMRGMAVNPNDRIQDMPSLKKQVLLALAAKSVPFSEEDARAAPEVTVLSDGIDRDLDPIPPQPVKIERKKSVKKTAVAIVILTVLLIGVGLTLLFTLNREPAADAPDASKASVQTEIAKPANAASQKSAAAVAQTAAPTVKPTAAPTEKNNAVIVPDVVGEKLSEAQVELEDLGINVETTYEYSDTVAEGYIIRQGREAGKQIAIGNTLMLYVSAGKEEPAEEEIPEPTEQEKPVVQETNARSQRPQTKAVPYLIQVYPNVYIHEDPDEDSPVVMTLYDANVYTIVEEQVDGDIVWGHLKSGVGWVIINDLLDNGGYILDD